MPFISCLAHLPRSLSRLALVLAALAATPAARALTNDELLPANLVGKTLTFTYGAATPNTLESLNDFTLLFTSASTYVRSGTGFSTASGTYSVLDSSIAASTGGRATTIQINNNWYSAGSTAAILLVLTQANGFGAYAASEFFNPLKNTGGLFTIGGAAGGGGTTAIPSITGSTQLTATVGTPFSYQIATSTASTSFSNEGGSATVNINPGTGLVTGTFFSAGTFTFSTKAINSAGASPTTTFTVTVTAAATSGTARYAGTYTGSIFVSTDRAPETVFSAFSGTVSNAGALVAQGGEVTGTGTAGGTIVFAANGLGLSTGTIVDNQFSALGAATTLGTTTRTYRLAATGGATAVAAAPANLVGYRNKVGAVFQFTVTGATTGAVWGTDVYTDDSAVATAAVHAGVLAVGETKTVTVTILPGQAGYTASTRNAVKASAWGAWAGSYSFAGAGAVAVSATGANVATARPALAPGYTFGATAYAAGGRLVLPISVVGGGTYSYQWFFNGGLIAGATANPYVVDSLTPANAGTYTVDVTNSLGTARLTAGSVTVGAAGSPTLALQPIAKTVVPGATFTLATNATGSGLAYQWFRNNVALAGETGAILLRNNANAADAGAYTVRVSNAAGSVTSTAATVTLSANASRPANISVRTNVAAGTLVTPGFVLQGSGTKRVLIRAVGPGLAAFGLTGTMADPAFAVFQGTTKIAENDNWSAANIGEAFTATGAFGLTPGSKDAALVTDLAAGKDYTVQVTNATGSGGIVLVEVYDADALKGTSTSKLVNVSVRGQTAPGADVLTLGLVIGGIGPRTLLVRGIGPKLAAFGVTGTVVDPRLQIVDSQQRTILANDDWSSADFVSELALATQYVGAFALDAGSKDAATLSLVDPGAYTIQVSGTAANPTGEALVEVYEVP